MCDQVAQKARPLSVRPFHDRVDRALVFCRIAPTQILQFVAGINALILCLAARVGTTQALLCGLELALALHVLKRVIHNSSLGSEASAFPATALRHVIGLLSRVASKTLLR